MENASAGEDTEYLELMHIACGRVSRYNTFGKLAVFLQLNIYRFYDLVIPVLGVGPAEMGMDSHQQTCSRMFTATISIIVPN